MEFRRQVFRLVVGEDFTILLQRPSPGIIYEGDIGPVWSPLSEHEYEKERPVSESILSVDCGEACFVRASAKLSGHAPLATISDVEGRHAGISDSDGDCVGRLHNSFVKFFAIYAHRWQAS